MTKFVGESADHAAAATGILATGEMPAIQDGGFIDAFECIAVPSVSIEGARAPLAVIDGLQDLRNAQGGFDVYNFEVEHHHTYVAAGIRVHNKSGLLGRIANTAEATIDGLAELFGAEPGGVVDTLTDKVFAPVHAFGRLLTGASELAINAVTTAGGWVVDKLTQFDEWLGKVFSVSPQEAGQVFIPGGTTFRDDGAVDTWNGGVTNPNSYYTRDFLDNYGTVTNGHAGASFGATVRAFRDLIGLDGKPGFQGTYRKEGEGLNRLSKLDENGGLLTSIRPRVRPADRDDQDSGGGWGLTREEAEAASKNNTNLNGEARPPIILDLDGAGVELTELQNSTVFVDSSGDGLQNRTAWAAAGSGVLFYDADGSGTISEKREYVFTEWDPTATSDIEALRSVFDTNGDGKLDWSDLDENDEPILANFKVLETNADGSFTARTLDVDDLNITSIDLTADATNIELPDGSVITGQTTFTMGDDEYTLADTTLVSEVASYRIEESDPTIVDGVRTHTQTGYGADGTIIFVIESKTAIDGSSVTNSYDDNGDGVVDRVQTIVTVTNGDGSKTRTVTNKTGSDFATGVLDNRTETITETFTPATSNGDAVVKVVTINRDSTGGGWFDQTEVRTTYQDDSFSIATTDRAPNGDPIRTSVEAVSSDGLIRTDEIDENGDGTPDLKIEHTITVAADGTRIETITRANADGDLISKTVEVVDPDGRSKTITRDLDGDTEDDVREELSIVVGADGSTVSELEIYNNDGSVRSRIHQDQSEDALTKTIYTDLDGHDDAAPNAPLDFEIKTVEETEITADGWHNVTVTETNADDSLRSKVKTTLGSDKTTSETWVDQNRDGVFQESDLSRSIVLDTDTEENTTTIKTTNWTRNPNGSFSEMSVSKTSLDGLETNIELDVDGDGDFDRKISDVTVLHGNGYSEQTISERSQDNTLINETRVGTSFDGLRVTTWTDLDGDGDEDLKSFTKRSTNESGETTLLNQTFALSEGDTLPDTLLSETKTIQSADRRTTTTEIDDNGDGDLELLTQSVVQDDGSTHANETRYSTGGVAVYIAATQVSADGLIATSEINADGGSGGSVETVTRQETVLVSSEAGQEGDPETNGDRVTTSIVYNGTVLGDNDTVLDEAGNEIFENGDDLSAHIRSQSEVSVSDDGLTVKEKRDANGDGVYERVTESVTRLWNGGGKSTQTETRSSDNSLLTSTSVWVSDDGLTTTVREDIDLDGSANRIRATEISYVKIGDEVLADEELSVDVGDMVTTTEYWVEGDLFSFSTVTESYDGREMREFFDVNGDSNTDRKTSYIIGTEDHNNGYLIVSNTALNADGTRQSQTITTTSDNGLVVTQEFDLDGDDAFERKVEDHTVLNEDGSTKRTISESSQTGPAYSETEIETSKDGRTVTTKENWDNDDDDDLTTVETYAFNGDGSEKTTITRSAANGDALSKDVIEVSADKETISRNYDADGNDHDDLVSETSFEDSVAGEQQSGWRKQEDKYFDVDGNALSTYVTRVSGDGLTVKTETDRDADGNVELKVNSVTTLITNGSKETEVNYTDHSSGNEVQLARQITEVSDDGFETTWRVDYDGDGTDEFVTRTEIVFEADGGIEETFETTDDNQTQLSHVRIWTSGDGLSEFVDTDFDDDAEDDLKSVLTIQADGAWEQLNEQFGDGTTLIHRTQVTESGDGWSSGVSVDADGDGKFDRDLSVTIDLDRQTISTWRDLDEAENAQAEITGFEAANGMVSTYEFDLNADGEAEFTRSATTTFGSNGSRITKVLQKHGPRLSSSETTTESADGLSTTVVSDYDGDGETDATTEITTTLNVDGSRFEKSVATYADDVRKSEATRDISADGRKVTETRDYDGDNSKDLEITTVTGADGRVDITEVSFDPEGDRVNTRVTKTSADGLHTNIHTDGGTETDTDDDTNFTITRSPIGNGSYETSYSGEFLSFTSKHLVDGAGIETWSLTRTITDEETGDVTTESFEFRLDSASRTRFIAEAERLYDTLLDRDLETFEYETLAAYVQLGELDIESLAEDLIDSNEFTTRFSDVTNATFISQIYTNTLGRGASLEEFATALDGLESGSLTRGQLAVHLSESSEHIVVGNGHISSNNFDPHLNPAKAERLLDKAYIWSAAESLVDVLYDINLVDIALELMAARALDSTETLLSLATRLVNGTADLNPDSELDLSTLNDEEFVTHVFHNALGREPDPEELNLWAGHLYQEELEEDSEEEPQPAIMTRGEFVLMIAMSVEHLEAGATDSLINRYSHLKGSGLVNVDLDTEVLDGAFGDYQNNVLDAGGHSRKVQISGGYGNDTVWGGNNDDFLAGDEGIDDIRGYHGNDVLFVDSDDLSFGIVHGGEGIDTLRVIDDEAVTVNMPLLAVEAVFSLGGDDSISAWGEWTEVTVNGGAGKDTITGGHATDYLSGNRGDDKIFGGGDYDFIEGGTGHDMLSGEAGDDVLTGSDGQDTLFGGFGDDYLYGGDGDDILYGETHDDWIEGGEGRDILKGGFGDDHLFGGDGDDSLYFWYGDDSLHGGDGEDAFYLQTEPHYGETEHWGWSVLKGGKGFDVLELSVTGFGAPVYTSDNTWQIVKHDPNGPDVVIDAQDIELVRFANGSVLTLSTDTNADNSDEYQRKNPDRYLGDSVARLPYWGFATWTEGHGRHQETREKWIYVTPPLLLNGLTGNDRQYGDDASNTLRGNTGNDTIIAWGGSDVLVGGPGDDVLFGGEQNDTLQGGGGADYLAGGKGADSLVGGEGSDTLWGEAGSDKIVANDGNDGVLGGSGNDEIHGNGGYDYLDGEAGDDTLFGGTGADELYGGDGGDLLVANEGADTLSGGKGHDRLEGGRGTDTLFGDTGNDLLEGGNEDDLLIGGDHNDTLKGGLGRDLLEGGAGADVLDGGDGMLDTAGYLDSDAAVTIDLSADTASGGHAEGDTLDNIENVVGSAFADNLTGNEWDNLLSGGDGNDTLAGGDAHDRLYGGDGDDLIYGGEGDDRIWGGKGEDEVYLGTGNDEFFGDDIGDDLGDDSIIGGDGNDVIYASLGNDTITGDAGNDFVHGEEGKDAITGGEGNDTLYGNLGDDVLHGEEGNDVLDGGSNADSLRGGDGYDVLKGGFGDDTLFGDDGNDTLYGNEGKDEISGLTGDDSIFGNAGNDVISGNEGADTVWGGDGDDLIYAGGGDDSVDGGDGSDQMWGGSGLDFINGRAGDDIVWGGSAADTLLGGDGADSLHGDDGADSIKGEAGDDLLNGNDGNDTIIGNLGNDSISGGLGDDSLIGYGDQDVLFGNEGADTLKGGDGNDTIYSGADNDEALGGSGADQIWGGGGDDILTGGAGADLFYFSAQTGSDEITDFDLSEGDRLQISDQLWADLGNLDAAQVVSTYASVAGSDVVFDFGNGDIVTLTGVTSTSGLENAIDIF